MWCFSAGCREAGPTELQPECRWVHTAYFFRLKGWVIRENLSKQCSRINPLFHLSKESKMNKSMTSILLAAMLASSGFAMAQSDVKAGTQGGSGPKPMNSTSETTRAEVKSQIDPAANKSGTQGGAGPERGAPTGSSGDVMPNTRADVKAQINTNTTKSGIQGGSGATPSANPNTANAGTTSAERQAKRAERRAARKAKTDPKMNGTSAGPTTTTSGSPVANPGATSRTLGQGQTSTPQTEGRP